MIEREGLFAFHGEGVTVIGEDINVGDQAQEFTVLTRDWTWMSALESTRGKVRIIGSLPSLSTSVCDRETKKFNDLATSLSDDIVILMVSMDLPFTHGHWCNGAGVEDVITLSDHKNRDFGPKYGVLLKEINIFPRAVFVTDRSAKVVYVEYLPVLGDEPEYEAVLEAARNVLDAN